MCGVGAPSGVLDDFNNPWAGCTLVSPAVGAPSGVLDDFNIQNRTSFPLPTRSGGSFGSPRRFQHGRREASGGVTRVGAPSGVLDDFNQGALAKRDVLLTWWGLLRESSTISTPTSCTSTRTAFALWGLLRESSTISTRGWPNKRGSASERWGLLRESSTISTPPGQPWLTRRASWGLLRESSTISTRSPRRSRRRSSSRGGSFGSPRRFQRKSSPRASTAPPEVGAPSGVLDDFNSVTGGPSQGCCPVGAPSGVLDDFNANVDTRVHARSAVGAPSGVLDDFNHATWVVDVTLPMWGLLRESSTISTATPARHHGPRPSRGGSFGSPRRFQRHQLEEAGGNASEWGLLRESSTISTLRGHRRRPCVPCGGSFGSPRRFQPPLLAKLSSDMAEWGLLRESPTISTCGHRRSSGALRGVGAPSGVLDDFNSTSSDVMRGPARVGAPSGVLDDFNGRAASTAARTWGLLRESSTISTPTPSATSHQPQVGAPSGVLDDFNGAVTATHAPQRRRGGSLGNPRRFQPHAHLVGHVQLRGGGSFGSPRRFQPRLRPP